MTDADVDFWTRFAEAHRLLANDFLPTWCGVALAALVLPYLGLHASFRRQTLTTIALPQCAFAGMAMVLAFPSLAIGADGEPIPLAVLFGVAAGTGVGLFVAARFRREGAVLGVAACFVAAHAVTEVARALSPFGETRLEPLLHGEVLGLHPSKLAWLGLLVVPATIGRRSRRAWLSTAVSPDAARAAGISPRRASATFAAALGTAVILSTLCLGPLLTSGLMLLPAAFARHDANDVGDTEREAGICALVAAWWGPVAAVMLDLPVGAGVVAALVVVGATSRAVRVRNVR